MSRRMRAFCETTGVLLVLLGLLGVIALFPAWLEFGDWNLVLTWFAVGDVVLVSAGALLFYLGDTRG